MRNSGWRTNAVETTRRGKEGREAATAIRSNYATAANDKQLLEGGTEWYMVQREGRQADGESG